MDSRYIEEGRAASKSTYLLSYLLFYLVISSVSQKAVSADIIPISAVEYFPPKNRRNKDISSSGILNIWLPHKIKSSKILDSLGNFKIHQ